MNSAEASLCTYMYANCTLAFSYSKWWKTRYRFSYLLNIFQYFYSAQLYSCSTNSWEIVSYQSRCEWGWTSLQETDVKLCRLEHVLGAIVGPDHLPEKSADQNFRTVQPQVKQRHNTKKCQTCTITRFDQTAGQTRAPWWPLVHSPDCMAQHANSIKRSMARHLYTFNNEL